ncbi:FAD:protein FMN transferase [Pseudoxanthomonas sp. F37]|uniref:FAD:protein FMN transferase n=1 Tax=Pseudoxanthomonas TaxID=83618 RepID=UPI001FD23937|nr:MULTISPECIES: FAD:protein FMN transferase [Pseudoxanthomonas]UOV04640.1 FAD:protein FMN transferase [Pseudoxanthomonas mexicana]UOV09651.1 FAD:protein FMN transferase [Pseudoxanthomonas sp. F37]
MNITPPSPSAPAAPVHALHGQTMGTTWSVQYAGPASIDPHALHDAIQARLDQVVAQMSTWEADADIMRFNRCAAGEWFVLRDDLLQVLTAALDIAARSDGAFDPTVSPLVAAWGFGAHARGRGRPTPAALVEARSRIGWQHLRFDPAQRRVRQPGGVMLDLSAIAKGYGVDVVAALLRSRGIGAGLVEVGGELYGYGRKADGQPWRVLVESSPEEEADSEGLEPRVLLLDRVAVATSGDRWHAYALDGRRYSHTIDPRSGEPVTDAAAAVTVVAPEAMHADAWATALTVMGAEKGHAFATRHGIAARFLQRTGEAMRETMTPAFAQYLAA